MNNTKFLFAVWMVLSIGLVIKLSSSPSLDLFNRPWPGYVGGLIFVAWFCASAWLLLGITPERLMRHLRNRC